MNKRHILFLLFCVCPRVLHVIIRIERYWSCQIKTKTLLDTFSSIPFNASNILVLFIKITFLLISF